MLIGHGVDPALYDDMHDGVLDLFTTTPMAGKMRFRAQRFGSVAQGYFPLEETSEIHPDLVEGWVWCRRAFDIPQSRNRAFRAEDYWPRPSMSSSSAVWCWRMSRCSSQSPRRCCRDLESTRISMTGS